MCDTFALGRALTRGGNIIFAKNSDREPDEVQVAVSLPRGEYPRDEALQCTYLTIPQAKQTNAVFLSKPSWMWGAEMGVNEKGVVIGNEALFTNVKPEKKPGLIGMDLLRLGLERSDTAREALEVIIGLLQRHGQGGQCGYRDKGFTYMNSFLIADRREMIVLETVGRDYAAQYYQDRAAISNIITLGDRWERSSLMRGTDMGRFTDPLISFFAGSRKRRGRVLDCVARSGRDMGIEEVFAILRGHYGSLPFQGFNQDVCMHAADPLVRKSHTTASLVVELDPSEGFRIFITGGSSPCLTPFKPVLPGDLPDGFSRGGTGYDESSFWWRNEAFRIQAEMRLSKVQGPILGEVRELEERFCRDVPLYAWNSRDEAIGMKSRDAFAGSLALADRWLALMKEMDRDNRPIHNAFWSATARRNGITLI